VVKLVFGEIGCVMGKVESEGIGVVLSMGIVRRVLGKKKSG
jgi:hypothetical protein